VRPLHRFLLPSFSLFSIVTVSGGFTAAWALACRALFPELFSSVSFYAYLMPIALPVLYSALVLRRGGSPAHSFLLTVAAMAFILCLIGAFREFIGMGTLLGKVVARPAVPWVKTVPGGLAALALFTGIFGALLRKPEHVNRSNEGES
jgi:Na+-transporting NADH:ubiquinone oxidoreductase subunit NqrD